MAVLVLAAGCQPGSGARDTDELPRLRDRLIQHSSEARFEIAQVRETVPISSLIETLDDGAEWTIEGGGGAVVPETDRLQLTFAGNTVRITRAVNWMAEEIDRLEVEVEGDWQAGERISLFWAAPGESFSEVRRLVWSASGGGPAIFDLQPEAQWSGPIGALRLDLPGHPMSGRTLTSIQAFRYDYDPAKLAGLAAESLAVSVDDELKSSVLASSGHPVAWELEEPPTPGDELRFSYALLGQSTATSRLRVLAGSGSGEQRTVFETTIHRYDRRIWREARVDLSELVPLERLTLEVDSENHEAFAGVAAWSDPSVVRPSGRQDRPNLVLLSLDTLRSDRLSLYGYEQSTSPRIDEWARRRATTFLHTVAVSPRTLPSHTSLFTGLDAIRHGVNHYRAAPDDLWTLAEILRRAGYKTVASTGGGLVGPAYGLDQGFDEFYSYPNWSGGFEELETEMERVLAKLPRLADQPFFLFFHTFEIHDPYHHRAPYSDHCYAEGDERKDLIFGAFPRPLSEDDDYLLHHELKRWKQGTPVSSATPADEDDLPLVRCLYDSGITYTDSQVGRLLDRLDEFGLLDDTVIVLTSDHGEAFGEHGLFKHASLYDDNLMIPLVIGLPDGRFAGRRIEEQVSTIDILPTVLDLLDLAPVTAPDGSSLVPLLEGESDDWRSEAWSYASHENRGASVRIDNRVKYIFNNSAPSPAFDTQELYDLRRDPAELDNLADGDPATAARLLEWIRSVSESRTPSTRVWVTNHSCDRLTGMIRLPALVTQLKAFQLSDGALAASDLQEARLSLGRGEKLEAFLESGGRLTLRLNAEGCDDLPRTEHTAALDLSALGGIWSLSAGPDGWIENSPGTEDDTGTAIHIQVLPSSIGPSGIGAEVDDQQALEQLRSLGYI